MITVISLFLIIILVVHRILTNKNEHFSKIPGPKGIPVVGNIQDYFLTEEESWKTARKRALEFYPIYKLKVFNQKMVHLLDPTDIEYILRNPTYIAKGKTYSGAKIWMGNGLLISDGIIWRTRRKLLTKCFHFAILKSYTDLINNGVIHLTKELVKDLRMPSDLNLHLNKHTFNVILGTLCGERTEPSSYDSIFLEAMKTLTKISGYKIQLPLMNKIYKFTSLKKKEDDALRIFTKYTSNLIENKANSKGNQARFLNSLKQNCDTQATKDEMNTFIFAGQDTVSTALMFIFFILANKPHFQDEIYEEMALVRENEKLTTAEINRMHFLDRFIKECLRMYGPATFIGRYHSKDISLPSGHTIPAGALIFIDIFDVHRNPKIYPDPEKFDPDRFLPENTRKRHPFSFIPFSAGPRNCIAQKFAMLEIKLTVCGILKKFYLKPVGSLDDIVLIPDILLKVKSSLKVIFTPRYVTPFF